MSFVPNVLLDSPKTFLLGAFTLAVTVFSTWKLLVLIVKPFFSELRNLPGPPRQSMLYGNFFQIFKAEPGVMHEKWIEEYGSTLTYKMLFNRDRLLTLDTKALSHILKDSYVWQKPPEISAGLALVLGEGLLFAEGDNHKRQRRILNPSFSLSHLRELTPIFLEKSAQLRDIWLTQSTLNGGSFCTDVQAWLNKATLDIIGLAGFDYEFNALNPTGQENELNVAFTTIFKHSQRITAITILQSIIPPLRHIPTRRTRDFANARKVMDRIGRELVEKKKRAILDTAGADIEAGSGAATKIAKGSIQTRDLLSRLMVANMATDLQENQRLADKDVFAQIPTFLIAGHETTATATSWCLYALAREPEIQTKLRGELRSLTSPMPSMEEINGLPYLDAVVRETLRLHPAVTATVRMATKDDVIPFGTPFKDKNGVMRHELRVRKGESIFIPISNIHTYKGIWGDDAHEFRPERWVNVPEVANDIPGVWGNLMSFIGGPRSCIGYRFALVETKCLIWTLVSGFTFEFVDPAHRDGFIKKSNIVTRPVLKAEIEKGSQLPLRITPFRAA